MFESAGHWSVPYTSLGNSYGDSFLPHANPNEVVKHWITAGFPISEQTSPRLAQYGYICMLKDMGPAPLSLSPPVHVIGAITFGTKSPLAVGKPVPSDSFSHAWRSGDGRKQG